MYQVEILRDIPYFPPLKTAHSHVSIHIQMEESHEKSR